MALLRFASPSIRQMATVGGNLVNASPVADLAVLLLALSAELELSSAHGNRRLPLSAFYRDYKQTALRPDEVLTSVFLPRNPDQQLRLHFDKVSHRDCDDIATVNTALVEAGGLPGCFGLLTVSAGGVGPCPLLLQAFADSVQGRAIGPDVVRSALSRVDADIRPISDHRGSADYKRHLLQHLLASHLCALHPELVFTECLP
jgi:xanthine dehydrogenase small subunit